MMCHDEFEDTKGVIRIPKSKDRQCRRFLQIDTNQKQELPMAAMFVN
jgi:hypothetical protein